MDSSSSNSGDCCSSWLPPNQLLTLFQRPRTPAPILLTKSVTICVTSISENQSLTFPKKPSSSPVNTSLIVSQAPEMSFFIPLTKTLTADVTSISPIQSLTFPKKPPTPVNASLTLSHSSSIFFLRFSRNASTACTHSNCSKYSFMYFPNSSNAGLILSVQIVTAWSFSFASPSPIPPTISSPWSLKWFAIPVIMSPNPVTKLAIIAGTSETISPKIASAALAISVRFVGSVSHATILVISSGSFLVISSTLETTPSAKEVTMVTAASRKSLMSVFVMTLTISSTIAMAAEVMSVNTCGIAGAIPLASFLMILKAASATSTVTLPACDTNSVIKAAAADVNSGSTSPTSVARCSARFFTISKAVFPYPSGLESDSAAVWRESVNLLINSVRSVNACGTASTIACVNFERNVTPAAAMFEPLLLIISSILLIMSNTPVVICGTIVSILFAKPFISEVRRVIPASIAKGRLSSMKSIKLGTRSVRLSVAIGITPLSAVNSPGIACINPLMMSLTALMKSGRISATKPGSSSASIGARELMSAENPCIAPSIAGSRFSTYVFTE